MTLYQAKRLAEGLFGEHGLDNWIIQFDNAKTRCAQCRYTPRVISLSRHYVTRNDEALVRNTILHEIAHALIGPGHGHNHVWKASARRVGAAPKRCNSNADLPPRQWLAHCDECGRDFRRHRLSQHLRRGSMCPCTNHYYGSRPILTWRKVA